LGDADQMEFRAFTSSGWLERVVRVPGIDLSVSAQDLDDEREGRLGPNPSASRLEAFSRLAIPDTKPAYTKVLWDSEGCIWAEEHRHVGVSLRSAPPRDWSVFGPQGKWLGAVRLPAPWRCSRSVRTSSSG
jgi:hypothetical protein